MADTRPRILVIDDEEHQLDTVCRGLRLYGFRCTGVSSVDAAFELLEHNSGGDFDLLLTDLTMPDRSGLELIERSQKDWPSLPIVVVTGLAATVEIDRVREMNIPLLQKPFTPDMLDAAIRGALVK